MARRHIRYKVCVSRATADRPRHRSILLGIRSVLAAGILVSPTIALGGQMATADRIQLPGWWPTKGTAPRSDFVGAEACAACHPAQAAGQATTAMARTAM